MTNFNRKIPLVIKSLRTQFKFTQGLFKPLSIICTRVNIHAAIFWPCELDFRYTIIRQFSSGNQRIREVIQFPDSLGEDAIFIGVLTSRGYLKGHRVLISDAPKQRLTLGIRSSVSSGFTFQTFISSVFSFLKGFPFQLSKDASHTPSF